mgnify:CR=1 FL=1
MANLVIDYLEETVQKFPDKLAYIDRKGSITFKQLRLNAFKLAKIMIEDGIFKKPILIYLEKSVECITAFMGTAYSGNFYSPIDVKMPTERIKKIIDTLQPEVILTDEKHKKNIIFLAENRKIITIEEIFADDFVDDIQILKCTKKIIDTDILYVLFTSGSTGVPKGVIINHKAVIDFTDWICKKYSFDENTVLGNQAQLYFDLSIQDVYAPLKTGATTVLIPNRMFTQPLRVWNTILDNKVNTLVWIPSMLSLFANLNILTNVKKASLKTIIFCGEVMPIKQLNYWIRNYPDTVFANLYGPTECTEACTYYTIDRAFEDDDVLPMGIACENSEAFIVGEDGCLITETNVIGELYMRGTCLSLGYYNNPEKTAEVFIQNPFNMNYPELVYKTGDLVRYNELGQLVYVSRKDFQIKHRGYRIELGEIDAAATSIQEIEYACCIYDAKADQLKLAYTGEIDKKEVENRLKRKLQEYMLPTEYHKMEHMLFNINGKVDRKALEEQLCGK